MKVCEVCGGMGHQGVLICGSCHGTGLISLGHESAAKYAVMIAEARKKAARLGWMEEVWEPVDPRENYPALGRKVRRVITVERERQTA